MDCVPVLIYKNKASSPDVKNRYPLRYSLTYGETVEIRICRRTVPCNFAGRSSREAIYRNSERQDFSKNSADLGYIPSPALSWFLLIFVSIFGSSESGESSSVCQKSENGACDNGFKVGYFG